MEVVEIGQKIKEVFELRNMKLTEFADELGTVRQNVYRIFKKRHVDTGLLLKVSDVLNFNFFQFYVKPPTNNESNVAAGNPVEIQTQLEQSRKEIEYLRKIIMLMEQRADPAKESLAVSH